MVGGIDAKWVGVAIPCASWHFHRRLFERYGIVLAPGDYSDMVKQIKKGKAQLLRRGYEDEALYCVEVKSLGQLIYVIGRKDALISAYPRRLLQPERKDGRIPVAQNERQFKGQSNRSKKEFRRPRPDMTTEWDE